MAGVANDRNYSFKVVLLGEGCVGKTSVVLRYVENKFNDKHLTTLQASFLKKKLNISGKRVNLSIWLKLANRNNCRMLYSECPFLPATNQKADYEIIHCVNSKMKDTATIYCTRYSAARYIPWSAVIDPDYRVNVMESCIELTKLSMWYILTLRRVQLSSIHDIRFKDTAGQERFHALGPIYYRDSNGAILVYDITDEDSFQKVKNWVKELRKMLGSDICLCIVGNKIDLEKERHVSVDEAESYAASVGAKHFHISAKLNKGIEEMFLDLSKNMIEKAGQEGQKNSTGKNRKSVVIVDDSVAKQQSSGGGCCGS